MSKAKDKFTEDFQKFTEEELWKTNTFQSNDWLSKISANAQNTAKRKIVTAFNAFVEEALQDKEVRKVFRSALMRNAQDELIIELKRMQDEMKSCVQEVKYNATNLRLAYYEALVKRVDWQEKEIEKLDEIVKDQQKRISSLEQLVKLLRK